MTISETYNLLNKLVEQNKLPSNVINKINEVMQNMELDAETPYSTKIMYCKDIIESFHSSHK